ncbi:hypothetical protein F9B85_04365 [Heliorestis acidaminivorans]|uniref:Uncharacterized protein n=1 Tax=Heliorestis acidaminivorans TaxID=553427 RepID=A0A6I0ET99_9FIRM|nr:hypothetical protein [Heliorestis acidaminivorans]KAB2953855.1 hypothetical protein F9B85_04365 [Heliorestis acidaminivorans]
MFNKNRTFVTVTAIILSIGLLGSTLAFTLFSLPIGADPTTNPEAYEERLLQDIQLMEEEVERDPSYHQGWITLGNNRYDMGRFKTLGGDIEAGEAFYRQAVEAYQKALEFDESNTDVRVDMATSAFYGGLHDVAEENFQIAIEKDPKHVIGPLNYGIFLIEVRQDYESARDNWARALTLNTTKEQSDFLKELVAYAESAIASAPPGAPAGMQQPDLTGLFDLEIEEGQFEGAQSAEVTE